MSKNKSRSQQSNDGTNGTETPETELSVADKLIVEIRGLTAKEGYAGEFFVSADTEGNTISIKIVKDAEVADIVVSLDDAEALKLVLAQLVENEEFSTLDEVQYSDVAAAARQIEDIRESIASSGDMPAPVAAETPAVPAKETPVIEEPAPKVEPAQDPVPAPVVEAKAEVTFQSQPESEARQLTARELQQEKVRDVIRARLNEYVEIMANPGPGMTRIRSAAIALSSAFQMAIRDDGDNASLDLLVEFFNEHKEGLMSERYGLRGTDVLAPQAKSTFDGVHTVFLRMVTNPGGRDFSVEQVRKLVKSEKFMAYIVRRIRT